MQISGAGNVENFVKHFERLCLSLFNLGLKNFKKIKAFFELLIVSWFHDYLKHNGKLSKYFRKRLMHILGMHQSILLRDLKAGRNDPPLSNNLSHEFLKRTPSLLFEYFWIYSLYFVILSFKNSKELSDYGRHQMDVGCELGQNNVQDSIKKHFLLPQVFDVFSWRSDMFFLHV